MCCRNTAGRYIVTNKINCTRHPRILLRSPRWMEKMDRVPGTCWTIPPPSSQQEISPLLRFLLENTAFKLALASQRLGFKLVGRERQKKKGLFLIHRDKSTGSTLTSEVERDGETTSELSSRIAHKERARARRVKQMRRPRSPPAYPILRSVVAANCCDVFGTLSPVRSLNCDVKVFSSRTFIPSLSLLYPSPGNGWATSRPASLPELTLAIL